MDNSQFFKYKDIMVPVCALYETMIISEKTLQSLQEQKLFYFKTSL